MVLREIVETFQLGVEACGDLLGVEVTGGYASDLLSDVIAHARKGDLWVTLQTHRNTVAVASMKELAAIVTVNGRRPEEETLASAREEGIPLLVSPLPAFELIGRLHGLGLSGMEM